MNYGKKGVAMQQRKLNSLSTKLMKMFNISLLKIFLILVIGVGVVGGCFGIGAFYGILNSAPSIENLDVTPTGYATIVYDNEGNEITRLVAQNSNRTYVAMDKIPDYLAKAFVAIEDERFYQHNGIDLKGIIRAGVHVVQSRSLSMGASTITQQLLKNNVFDNWIDETNWEKITRKIQEQYLAIELEKQLSKEVILEKYMNTINLGQNTLGVQAAALRYFDKSVWQLTISESAVIAAITQNPTRYNPILHPDYNADRREYVLQKMLELEFISQQEYDIAMADDVYSRIQDVNTEVISNSVYSYFVDELLEELIEDLLEAGYTETQAYQMIYSGGLKIYTTQNRSIQSICDTVYTNEENFPTDTEWLLSYQLTIQLADETLVNYSTEMYQAYYKQWNPEFDLLYPDKDAANAAVETYVAAMLAESGEGAEVFAQRVSLTAQPQSSIVITDQENGYILAMVGGRGIKEASRTLNRASNTMRQPGSTFKVVSAYAPALDSAGLTLASVQTDAPFWYSSGKPVKNWWGEKYRGILSYRYGIVNSANIIAVKTQTQISPRLGYDYLLKFGFTTLVERRGDFSDIGQSLALGSLTDGVTCLELNAAYATIANGGEYIEPTLYTKVYDHNGNLILDKSSNEVTRVIKETTAFLLTDAMEDVVTVGTGKKVNFGNMAIAGKTGSTSSYNDVWFAGYTPYYTATVWTGYDNNKEMEEDDEKKNLSKTLWRAVMAEIHANLPSESFVMPSGIVTAQVCSMSGKLPVPGLCDAHIVTEYFEEGTQPTTSCDSHYIGYVCQYTGQEASDECPFKIPASLTKYHEDSSLLSGSVEPVLYDNDGNRVDWEGNILLITPESEAARIAASSPYCPHNAEFYADPNYEAVLALHRAYIQAQQ